MGAFAADFTTSIPRRSAGSRFLGSWLSVACLIGTALALASPLMAAPAAPEIDVSPTSLSFGNHDIDDGPTAPMTVTIQNIGAANLNFTGAEIALGGSNPSDFTIASDSGENPLPPSASRTVQITFDPAFAGNTAATLIITSDDADEATVNVPMTATGTDEEIDVSTLNLSFGNQGVAAGPTAPGTVIISNTGFAPLDFTGAEVALGGTDPGEFGIFSDTGQNPLGVGLSRHVNVIFDPSSTGAKSAELVITSEDNDEPTVTVSLTGTGTAAAGSPEIDVSPGAIPFGQQGVDAGATPPQTVTITNVGLTALTFTGPQVALGGVSPSEFGISSDTGENPLAPSSSRVVDVIFDPTARGVASAELTITSDDADEPVVTVTLSGLGIGVTVQELVSALLGIIPATPLIDFDLNGDGRFDVADLVTRV